MKILLTAVNAKYIHSNLGIYSLKAYADQVLGLGKQAAGMPGQKTVEPGPEPWNL